MNAFWRALSAEALKTRRTLALTMTVLAPFVIALMNTAMYLQREDALVPKPGENVWVQFGVSNLTYWALLMLPLFVALETALLAGVDHSQRHWTLLYSLPVARWAYYAAKQVVALGLIALSTACMIGWIVVAGTILQVFAPQLGFDAPIQWQTILERAGFIYGASWLMISLQMFVAMRWPSFVVAVGVGISGTVGAVFVVQDELAYYYPWTLAGVAAVIEAQRTHALLFGLAGGLVAALLAGWYVSRRDAA